MAQNDPPSAIAGALDFYYQGFRSALIRYRALTFAGWCAAVVGGAGTLGSCRSPGTEGLWGWVIPLMACAAGLMLVQQSVASLDAYVRIRFPIPDEAACPPNVFAAIAECARLMDAIDRGGWLDAYAALRAVRTMEERYELASLLNTNSQHTHP